MIHTRTKKITMITGLLLLLLVGVNCQLTQSQAAVTFTSAELENMAMRSVPTTAAAGVEPELPRLFINTTYVPPTGGRAITVNAGGNFQDALNQAQYGDVIMLQAGATFTGNFRLPAKTGSGWIVVRSSAPDSSLPPQGTRINPTYSSVMPKLVTPNGNPVIDAADGAHHFRFIGVEFTLAPSVPGMTNLIVMGDNDQTSLSQLAHNIIFDRVYIHGNATANLRRGIAFNSAYSAVIDSYISDCHEIGRDSQAILVWNNPGPIKIVNNYLEGAGENFMSGGADPRIVNLVPSDIEFRRNYCFKPLSWKVDDPSYAGRHWSVKNLFELKNAQRVLVEGNVFENNWADAQVGFGILFTTRNDEGTAPWSVVQDVTFINNIVRHSGSGVNINGFDDLQPSNKTRRIRISNNLFDDINGPRWGLADGRLFQLISGPFDVTIEHNTAFQTNHIAMVDGETPAIGFVFRNNLMPNNQYGFFGSGRGTGTEALGYYFPNSVFTKNVIVGGNISYYPANNFFPATIGSVGFVDFDAKNYRLNPSSPYKNAGTDGKDIGCDFDVLNAAISGTAVATMVSAASFSGAALAPESIAAAFGTGLSSTTLSAASVPLPTSLGGTTVKVRDRLGVERLSMLFFVSPTQVNYLLPAGTSTGTATVTFNNGEKVAAISNTQIENVMPGIFTADASGRGLPAASVLRIKPNTSPTYEPIARFDTAQNKYVAVPIDLGPATDQVFLILYSTGIRFRTALSAVTAKIGGADAQVTFAGAQGTFLGLDQTNILISRSLIGRGEVTVSLTVDGQKANDVIVNVK